MPDVHTTRTRVKICGITRPADAQAAEAAGCDAVGLVLWEGSRRYATAAAAAEIGRTVSPRVKVVGVFVDATVEIIMRWATRMRLDAVQLCGRMPNGPWAELAESLPLIRSIGVTKGKTLDAARVACISDYLLDAATEEAPGGTGMTFDWADVEAFRSWGRIWLAGGLDPGNVAAAIETVRPYAVDVSTGVEEAPGHKSRDKIAAFIASVRAADELLRRGT